MQLHYRNVIQKLLLMYRPIYYVAVGTVLSYFLIGMYAFYSDYYWFLLFSRCLNYIV